jgi:hypothetical protein
VTASSDNKSDIGTLNQPPAKSKTSFSNRPPIIAIGLFLFLATGLVVVWQNSRLAVLWDLSYILENAFRISIGDLPYRDFPFPYAPLTFLIQAAIIKLTGRVFWHTIVYCAIAGGAATVVTWRTISNLLDRVAGARWLAFVLSLPLIVLGIYCVFPHPFYDPDCTLSILLALLLWQRADRKPTILRSVITGIAIILPLFVKQNTGLAFLLAASGGTALLALVEKLRGESIRQYSVILISAAVALGLALLLIQFTVGLTNYWHWTMQFAAARRTPERGEMIAIYKTKAVALSLFIFAIGLGLSYIAAKRSMTWLSVVSGAVMGAPFAWPAFYLFLDHDSSERADRLLNVWPLILIISFAVAIITIRKRRGLDLILPFVLVGTINGAFMSQQLWGSTYAIWPMLLILLADVLKSVMLLLTNRSAPALGAGRTAKNLASKRLLVVHTFAVIIVGSLVISGGAYVYSHERLDYANLDDGAFRRSTLHALKGLRTRGDWLPNFEELIRYTDANITRDEPILIIPGEDLFYYTTGRRPQFPVLLFDRTVNPYSPAEVVSLARDRKINWLIIKQDLQDEDEDLEKQRDALTEALEEEFEQVESLKGYDIYKRAQPDEDSPDEP